MFCVCVTFSRFLSYRIVSYRVESCRVASRRERAEPSRAEQRAASAIGRRLGFGRAQHKRALSLPALCSLLALFAIRITSRPIR